MTQHASTPVVPPDRLASHVPANLSAIVLRMVAKQPVRRYQSMAEVVAALEDWLGINPRKPFAAWEEHVDRLEQAAREFDASPWLKRCRWATVGFVSTSVLAVVIARDAAARGCTGDWVLRFAEQCVLHPDRRGSATHNRGAKGSPARTGGLMVWLRTLTVLVVLSVLVVLIGALTIFVVIALLAAGTACGFFAAVDRPLWASRRNPITTTEDLLRELRLGGLDETGVRQFVWKYAGRRWEELFEQLFGYDALLDARRWEVRRVAGRVGDQARRRPRSAPWRDPLVAGVDRLLSRRQRMRQAKLLAALESRALQAKGMDLAAAEATGAKNARRLIKRARKILASAADLQLVAPAPPAPTLPPARQRMPHLGRTIAPPAVPTGMPTSVSANWMHQAEGEDEDASWEPRHRQSYLRRRFGTPIDVLAGSGVRLLLALLILAAFAAWFDRNGGKSARQQLAGLAGSREEAVAYVQRTRKGGTVKAVRTVQNFAAKGETAQPLRIAHVPDWACNAVGRWNGGLAGLLLLSMFFAGPLLALSKFAAAATCLLGDRLPWPVTVPINPLPAADALGLIIWILGVFFLRKTI